MKIFYHCYGGAHTSIVCAAIHLNYLTKDDIPAAFAFKEIPFYDKMKNNDIGSTVFVGTDEYGCDIYIMGMRNGREVVIPAIKGYLNEHYITNNDILFVNALVELHPVTALGGMLSRRLGLVSIGQPLTIWGIRRYYKIFVELVGKVQQKERDIISSS